MSCWMSFNSQFKLEILSTERYEEFKSSYEDYIGKWIPDVELWPGAGKVASVQTEAKFASAWKHPDRFVPFGSEGTAQVSIGEHHVGGFEEPDYVIVNVTGNLRDVESFEELQQWFHRVCAQLKPWHLDSGMCTAKLSWENARLYMSYGDMTGINTVMVVDDYEEDFR